MKMYRLFILLAIIALGGTAFAQGNHKDFPNYGDGSLGLCSSPSTQNGAAAGFWNPAAWAAMREWELSFQWNDSNVVNHKMDNWGLSLGGSGFGFAVRHMNFPATIRNRSYGHVEDYQLSVGGGDRADYWGLSYGWSGGDRATAQRDKNLTLGNIYRPCRYGSVGGAVAWGLKRGNFRGIFDLGVRPLGTHRLTAFADAAFDRHDTPASMQWGAGLEIQPLDGILVAGKVSKDYGFSQDKIYSVSIGLNLDGVGFSIIPHYNKDSKRVRTSYLVRLGEQQPGLDTRKIMQKDKRVLSLNMKGRTTYQTAKWFDRDKMALLDMLNLVDRAKDDPTISGIALNLSGFTPSRELSWELREKLKEFKAAGKKVYIYVDEAGMTGYYFATVADYVWIDPTGMLLLPGYVAGRTYYKNFLGKLGLGVEEWRYFAYKSAFETFSRTNMSDKDREQRQALISDFYDEWEKEVCAARHLSPEAVRALRDTVVALKPDMALKAGFVDTIGTWDDTKDFVKKLSGKAAEFVSKKDFTEHELPDQIWGPLPQIALVYAVGDCAMDEGIHGRATSRALRHLGENKQVKAIVLRADSPGGEVLPSDLVAREMKSIGEKKPMVVTQGDVAGSGGYWISMNGSRIFSSPMTITGSIGVIGGWIWNDKFSDKSGFTFDKTQIGEHADLGSGLTLPLIGATIPDRAPTDVEHQKIEALIRSWYKDFTERVATGRNLDVAYVDSIGQGRVWTGTRALKLKLVDEIGGMDQAIQYARNQAGIPKNRKFEVVEYPRRPLFGSGLFGSPSAMELLSRMFVKESDTQPVALKSYEWQVLQHMAEKPGKPLFMIPPEDLPDEDRP